MKYLFILLIIYSKSFAQKSVDTTYNGFKVEFFETKSPKSKIEYRKGKPHGLALFYFENGKLKEMGTFVNNRWVGNYQKFYETGQVQHNFNFDKSGKRIGLQRYYHSNGVLALLGLYSTSFEEKNDEFVLEFDILGKLIDKPILLINGEKMIWDTKLHYLNKEKVEALMDLVNHENEIVISSKKQSKKTNK